MKSAFVAKQFMYESTFLVITDPTSLVVKNVTPYCSQIFEVLQLFKSCHVRLLEVQEECLAELGIDSSSGSGGGGRELSAEEIDAGIEEVLARHLGEGETILGKLLNMIDVKKCSHSLDE